MSEHHDAPKAHEPHTLHEEPTRSPHNPKSIPRWLLTLPIGRKSSASPATSSTKPSVGMVNNLAFRLGIFLPAGVFGDSTQILDPQLKWR